MEQLKRRRLKPKSDFIFKRLFGENETKEALISLLNAILRLEGDQRLVDLHVMENTALMQELIHDKTGRLDIRAETLDGVQINIEMQLTDKKDMDRRTLFYFGKLFLESVKTGDKYQDLKRTITINVLDFNYLSVEWFHSTFHLYEDHDRTCMLTDVMEIHFIECPKFRATPYDRNDPLHRWLLFMEEELAESQLKELVEMDPVIRKTEERLGWLSSDEETLRLYEARENSRIEFNSKMYSAREEGREEGKAEGKAEVIKQLLASGVDINVLARSMKLSLQDINKLIED